MNKVYRDLICNSRIHRDSRSAVNKSSSASFKALYLLITVPFPNRLNETLIIEK